MVKEAGADKIDYVTFVGHGYSTQGIINGDNDPLSKDGSKKNSIPFNLVAN